MERNEKNGFRDLIRRSVGGSNLVDTSGARHEARRLGDAARDARNWPSAVDHYDQHLRQEPADGPIWVQLGHARKESGDLPGAEAAYRQAEQLMPNDSDLALQIGHLLKLSGRSDDAAGYYRRSNSMMPSQSAQSALAELEAPAPSPSPVVTRPGSRGRTYMQINDFLFYLQHHKTVSGIQRVQLGVINYALAQLDTLGSTDVHLVTSELRGTKLRQLSENAMRAIVNYLAEPEVNHSTLRQLITDALASGAPVEVRKGDVFFLLGAFWGMGGSSDLLRFMKSRGVKTGIYFYDLIPVTNPEYCDDALTADFTQALVEALSFADFALAISEYSASEVRRFVAANDFLPLTVEAVPLAHAIKRVEGGGQDGVAEWPASLSSINPGRYVLYVSTIEARKNHRYLFDAWKKLAEEGVDVPDLVFVGRRGWRVDDLYAQFKATNYLNGRIKVLHDLSDSELTALYRECLFTVFPSVVEGWGLPIGESLSHGKLCVASNSSSMPEVGGEFVEYIDPWNLRAGLDTFRTLLTDPAEIRRREANIRDYFIIRDWETASKACVETLLRLAGSLTTDDRPTYVPRLDPGEVFSPARPTTSLQASGRVSTSRLRQSILHDRWNTPENFGTWMEGHEGHITFMTAAGTADEIVIFMQLTTVPWVNDNVLTIHGAGLESPIAAPLQPNATGFALRFRARSDQTGKIALRLIVSGELAARDDDRRLLSIGVRQIAYAPFADALARVQIVEALMLDLKS